MIPPYWDNATFIFYYGIGILCSLMVGTHFGNLSIGNSTHIKLKNSRRWDSYVPLIVILVVFACFRKVAFGIGGTDALSYEQDFINVIHGFGIFEVHDKLFGYYTLLIRYFTSEPFIYRLISYTIIALGFCYYIREMCPRHISCTPFILVAYLFICGFNTMRSTMAISFSLISFVGLLKKDRLLTWVFFALSCLFHRMMFVFLPVMLLFYPIYNFVGKCNKSQLLIVVTGLAIVFTFLARLIQKYVLLFGLLDKEGSADAGYIANSLDTNILESWPMFIQEIFLLFLMALNYKKYNSRKKNFALTLSCVDIVVTVPALILGIWRISQCLLIPTLILWGILIYDFCHKFNRDLRPIISFTFFLGFSFIFYVRIHALYESSSLMPYMFFWQ